MAGDGTGQESIEELGVGSCCKEKYFLIYMHIYKY